MEVCLFSSLETLRNEIKQIDDNIVKLIANRLNIVKDIGMVKVQQNMPIKNANVEMKKMQSLTRLACKLGVPNKLLVEIFTILIDYALFIQEKQMTRIAIKREPRKNDITISYCCINSNLRGDVV